MCRNWSLREYQVARQLRNAGCPLEIPWGPRGEPKVVIQAEVGTLNQIVDLGLYQTGYALELVIADNVPGEFIIEYVGLVLPWVTTLVDWFDDPSDWQTFADLRCLNRGGRVITDKDLLKLPYRMRRRKVLRFVLFGVSYNPIPEEFLTARRVPGTVILENYWGERCSGSINLTVSQSQAARLARQPVERPAARQRRSIFEERDPVPFSIKDAGAPSDRVSTQESPGRKTGRVRKCG
jgi:hypothetical protein